MKRRDALFRIAACLAPVGALAGCLKQLSYRTQVSRGVVRVPADRLAELSQRMDTLTVWIEPDEVPVVVRREGGDYTAIVAICTHRQCALTINPDGYSCRCHGSSFGIDGDVYGGPATTPLGALPTRRDDRDLLIQVPG